MGEGGSFHADSPQELSYLFFLDRESHRGSCYTSNFIGWGGASIPQRIRRWRGDFFSFMTRRILSWIKEMCVWKLNLLGVDDVTEAN
jgi:hypothetical protein